MAPDDPNDPAAAPAAGVPERVDAPERADAPDRGDVPDRTVKQMLDTSTLADLERWFGLPSFQELAEKKEEPPTDPELLAAREARAKAIAAVDPAIVESHRRRIETGDTLLQFKARIELRIDPTMARLDYAHIEAKQAIAEPREVEISDRLRDDLTECTPQAILRDLHRSELYFDKIFEVVDMAAEQRLDIVAAVAEAMRTSWRLPPLDGSVAAEGRALLAELRVERMRSIAHVLPSLPNRRVTEP
jgi:hypothetical protein